MLSTMWGIKIPMRDGIQLAADLFLPTHVTERVPAVIIRTPYGRHSQELLHQAYYFRDNGYAVLNVDVRGRGDSDGEFIPYRNEGKDGYDTVEWAAAQTWSNGAVGTLGGSYLAKVQWLCALEHPPHLKAMIPLVSPSDPFVEWPTGVPIPSHVCWLFLTSGRTVQPIDAVDWLSVYQHLPLVTMDEAAGRSIPMWHEEFEHLQLDDWWKQVSYQTRFDEIDIPVMHISGWYDDEQVGTPLNYSGMVKNAPSEWVRKAQRLIMGPWPHRVNQSTRIGEVDFGPSSVIDLRGKQLRFFDRWLKGTENGVDEEDPVEIFVMGKNEWRTEQSWPIRRATNTHWYLHSTEGARSIAGDGALELEPSLGDSPSDTYLYDPELPVPFITEETSNQIGGPDDYREVHERDDVLVYSGPLLEKPLEVSGAVRVELFISSTARDTDFMAQIHDVWPNGYVQRLCDGMVRVRFRHGMECPQLLHPGSIAKLTIECWNTSHVFLPGHRIRLHIASSAFPKYDRNPNTGDELGLSSTCQIAEQTVFHCEEYPSALILPIVE